MIEFDDVSFSYHKANPLLQKLSFCLDKGKSLGILGESGSGKSTIAKLICGFYKPTAGTIKRSGTAQMIFQNPTGSLNPRWTIREILTEPLQLHGIKKDPIVLLSEVGMGEEFLSRYPSQLSGGQCQRVALARAVSLSPDFVIADESTSALDHKTEEQVLMLLKQKQSNDGFGLIVISHSPEVIRRTTDAVVVLRKGVLVESGSTEVIFSAAKADYTILLLGEGG
jgi:peptide/nickel transport system ATP-binding protein